MLDFGFFRCLLIEVRMYFVSLLETLESTFFTDWSKPIVFGFFSVSCSFIEVCIRKNNSVTSFDLGFDNLKNTDFYEWVKQLGWVMSGWFAGLVASTCVTKNNN